MTKTDDASAHALPPSIAPNSILAVMPSMGAAPPPPVPSPPQQIETPPPPQVPVPATEHTSVPALVPASTPPTPPTSPQIRCALCRHKFKDTHTGSDAEPCITCACCRRQLVAKNFSKNQRSKGTLARCFICVAAGANPLKLIRRDEEEAQMRRDGELPADTITVLEKRKAPAEKRKATMERKKREREEEEALRERLGLRSSSPEPDILEMSDEHRRMGMAIRNLLRDHRSIERRRAVNDLRSYDREEYELQLLTEEQKLHQQAAALCASDPTLYDEVRAHLRVVDGAVRYGERDHEQGECDGDTRRTRAPVAPLVDPGHALLEAATMTSRHIRAQAATPPPKQKRRRIQEDEDSKSSSDTDTYTVTTRSGRRSARPLPHAVIEIDDSD